MSAIRVAIIDDQTLVRGGIRSLLELSDRVAVVAEGADGDEAVALVCEASPDVVLMDIQMPRVNGIEAIGRLQAAGLVTPVIILTTFDDHRLVLDGIRAGARGFLLKDVSLENLIAAIESVHRGETMLQPAITATVMNGLAARSDDAHDEPLPVAESLTPRETEILRLMAGGYSNREISAALSKSEGTVKNHVSNILGKLDARDRTRAVLRALQAGLI